MLIREAALADGDEGDARIGLVSHHAVGTGVEGWLAVDDELVTVMAVMEVYLGAPRAVDLAVHKVLA